MFNQEFYAKIGKQLNNQDEKNDDDVVSVADLDRKADEIMSPDEREQSYKRELEVAEEMRKGIDYEEFLDKDKVELLKYINDHKPQLAKEAVQRLNKKILKEKRKEKFRQDLKDKINSLTNFIKKPFRN